VSLSEQLWGDRTKVLKLWFQTVLESYPKQSRTLIAVESDRFANPIGSTLNDAIEDIFATVAGKKTVDDAEPAIAKMVKLKAVQEGSSEGQLAFLFALKPIIRKTCGANSSRFSQWQDLLEIEDRIDLVILRAMEIFIQSREKILELQVDEIKNKTYSLRKLSGDL